MYIIENRLEFACAIELINETQISYDELNVWLGPFFSISNSLKGETQLGTIVVTQTVNTPFSYGGNSDFYVDGKMNSKSIYYNILYISRAVFKCLANQFGYENIHAGCISNDNIGILIKAKRNQGKTTIILHALISKKFQLIANDQVMFDKTNMNVLGYPAGIGIRNNSCTSQLQSEIIKKALWLIEDPFQSNKKPVILINDLSNILTCEVKKETKIGVILEYEKSMQDNELFISPLTYCNYSFSELSNPLSTIYDSDIVKASLDCISKAAIQSLAQDMKIQNTTIKHIKVRCGRNCIDDMFQELKNIT